MQIIVPGIDLLSVLDTTQTRGYAFLSEAVLHEILQAMEDEIRSLTLESGDHETHPINKGTPQEVRQLHERAYRMIGHSDVPVGTRVCYSLAQCVSPLVSVFPELSEWMPTEIGYQRYRAHSTDWISPHRDRKSDHLLSVTITITGSAWMKIYESEVDPPDYSKLKLVNEFLTAPGTIMFLRAPGFGSGKQVIHEVLPPIGGDRFILNLRMRSSLLKSPGETRYE